MWGSLISLRPLFALSALSTDPSAFGTSPTSGEEWSDGSGHKNVTREEGGSLRGLWVLKKIPVKKVVPSEVFGIKKDTHKKSEAHKRAPRPICGLAVWKAVALHHSQEVCVVPTVITYLLQYRRHPSWVDPREDTPRGEAPRCSHTSYPRHLSKRYPDRWLPK